MKQMNFLKVVAAVGLAVVMLFPVLSGADVVNNLKDLGSADILYSTDPDQGLPPPPNLPNPPGGVITQNVTFASPISVVQFVDSGIPFLAGVSWGSLAWGDYDNDGYLDLAVCGSYITKIYRNMTGFYGCPPFIDINAGIPGVSSGSLAWGDYDNDGDLDLAVSGSTGPSHLTAVYRNNGDNTFTDIEAGIQGVSDSSIAWGDYDNDGKLDLAICGFDGKSPRITRIYKNNGDDTFTDINAGLPGVTSSPYLAWGDYDNDGDLDLAICGWSGSSDITRIYRNDGNNVFTDAGAGLTGVKYSSLAWGDYDNDGDLDLALSGVAPGGGNYITRVYKNNGNSNFTNIGASIAGVQAGSVAWGDYDNDGYLDLAVCGDLAYPSGTITAVYKNNGNDTFTDIGAGLPGAETGVIAWGDYDNDGDLDLAVCGGSTKIYDNLEADYGNPNTIPLAPENLTYELGSAILKWDSGFDEETPDNGLYYNIRVRKVSLAPDVVSSVYGSPLLGNYLRPKLSDDQLGVRLDNLSYGIYYWMAQTIDTGLEKSDWSNLSLFINVPTGHVVGWGYNFDGQSNTLENNDFIAIASGAWHNLAIQDDGSLVAWGRNSFGCCDVPDGNDFVAVDAGHYHSLALRSDGSLVAWGFNMGGAWQVPEGNDFVAISCGPYDNLALKSDGSLVSWGWNEELPEGNDFIAIAAGMGFNIALRSDGSLAAAGGNYFGQCNVPEGNDFIAVSAGDNYAVALKSDGSLVAWGNNDSGQCDVPEGNDFVAVTTGEGHNIALKSDGSLVAWGNNRDGQCNVPEGNDFVAIAAGMGHSVAIRTNYIPVADAGEKQTVYAGIDGKAEVILDGTGSYDGDGDELSYLWLSDIGAGDTIIATEVNPTIELTVGKHTINLIVNDGKEDSEPDTVVINVVGPLEVQLSIYPQMIHRNNHYDWGKVMAWMQMPSDITKDQIDEGAILKLYPGGIEAVMQHVIQYQRWGTEQTRIYAFFNKEELLDAVPENGLLELTVVGKLKTGQYFYGSNNVNIIGRFSRGWGRGR